MVRTATDKYGFWLAGYYEDFIGSRCVADDSNQPSTTGTYDATTSHHGNILNGEATLNPRFRWCVRDRANNSEYSNSTNYLLSNEGISVWATFDANRLSKGRRWCGRGQIQYPQSFAHPNRLRYDKAGVASTDDSYMLISSSYDTSSRYYIPAGDTDASYGRNNFYEWNGRNWFNGYAGVKSAGNTPDFMQYGHLTGVFAGERIQMGAYDGTTGNATTHENNAELIFNPIKSKAGKPFLCVMTYLADDTAHQLDNQTPTGQYRPIVAYNSPLNSRSDGDYFTIRLAVHSMLASTPTPVINEINNTSAEVDYVLKIGFPTSTTFGTTGSNGGTAAIEWEFKLHDGTGLSATAPFYHTLWNAGTKTGSYTDEMWIDLDFKIDYTNNKFKVYHDGTEVTATNPTAGSYSSGYTMNNNTDTSSAFTPKELTGWEMFVTPSSSTYNKCIVATMIDRVALYRPLTNIPDGTLLPAPVNSWTCDMLANGVSSASIDIFDDDTEQDLTVWFLDDDIVDWRLLMFSGNIHRPLWNGLIDTVDIKQTAKDRTRQITINARDSLSLLDRQMANWEIGQIGLGTSDQVLARKDEIAILDEALYLGAGKLQQAPPTIGFESGTGYVELQEQRTSRLSAHPIQMYNNENPDGANNVENAWLGYEIIGYNSDSSANPQVIVRYSGTSFAQLDNIEIFGSNDHNGSHSITNNPTTESLFGLPPSSFGVGQVIELSSPFAYTANATGNLVEYTNLSPINSQASGYLWFKFSQRPQRTDNTYLKEGEYFIVSERDIDTVTPTTGTNPPKSIYKVLAYYIDGNDFWVKSNYVQTSTKFGTYTTGWDYNIDKGYISPTDDDINMRNAHAVWLRQLPKSAWFKRTFGVYDYSYADAGNPSANFTADATYIQVGSSFFSDSDQHGVGQVVTTSGFVDTFTYTGILSPASDGNHYIVGVRGLSIDHTTADTVYTLTTSNDYKHCWLHWADMRNNGDADADNGFRKNNFGLLNPLAENYEVGITFTDQFDNDGSYKNFLELKISEDIAVWEIDSTNDPSTSAPFSKPIEDTTPLEIANGYSGNSIDSLLGGGIKLKLATATASSGLSVGDEVIIMGTSVYTGIHTITALTGTYEIEFSGSTYLDQVETYGVGQFIKKVEDDYRVSDLASWHNTGGCFLVYDAAPFFNLNTFINKGTFNQYSGGRVNLGEYETDYHGFPILMDNYWLQATSTSSNNAAPYGYHENFRKWVGATAELNRTILLNDTVIETKPSSSLISEFLADGYGKIKATRGSNGQLVASDVFYYTYDGKLDTGVVESATSNTTAGTNPFVITCSGADFVNDGVAVGMRVRNVTAKWVAQITAVTATTITITEADIYQETGSTRADVQISDSISIPQQLYGVYVESDAGRGLSVENAEARLVGILADSTTKSNGATAEIKVNVPNQTALTGAYDEVIIIGSVSPRFALRFLMNVEGYVESPNGGTYWLHDKARFIWAMTLSDTWLTQASMPVWFDIGSVPLTSEMTTDGTNTNFDSFGSVYDSRGGKSLMNIVREATESTGYGYTNASRLALTYQMGRDNKLEIRPAYNCGEAITRSNLMVSSVNASMGSNITNVRVYYNDGSSFADFPQATLNQTYRWSIIEMPNITTYEEALSVATEEYNKKKTKALSVSGEIIRDLDDTDKMLTDGRYGYIADTSKYGERGVCADVVVGSGFPTKSADYNYSWSGMNGHLCMGMMNAIDGNLKTDGSDKYFRERYGTGYIAPSASTAGSNTDYTNNYWWWGANSVSHAVQIVHIPTTMPLDSDTTSEDLRIWVALKDGQSGTDIENAEFTIGISDTEFDATLNTFFGFHGQNATFTPTLSAINRGVATVDVKYNGFYEIDIPSSYWSSKPAGAKIVISVNVDYLRDILYHRCGDPTASGILHNAHDITEMGVSSWANTNANSLFPLGVRKFNFTDNKMSGLHGVRNAWYCPRINIVEDIRWRPATQVTMTDSGLGLSSEVMSIRSIAWSVKGRDIESVKLDLERDHSKERGGLASYLFPNIARRKSSGGQTHTGATNYQPRPPYRPITPQRGETSRGTGGVNVPLDEGGRFPNQASGSFSRQSGANLMTRGAFGNIRGNMALDSISNGSSFSVLGQNRINTPMTSSRSVDGLGDSISPTSATGITSDEGYVFAGTSNPESTNQYTITHTMTVKVPDDVADEIVSVSGMYSLGGNGNDTGVIYATIECVETGTSFDRTINLSGNKSNEYLSIFSGITLTGASTENNTIKVTLKRKPTVGDDTADYSSIVLKNVKVNFTRFSVKSWNALNSFNPFN